MCMRHLNARPAEVLVVEVTNYALDFVVANLRSKNTISEGSNKCSLFAADLAEKGKEASIVTLR